MIPFLMLKFFHRIIATVYRQDRSRFGGDVLFWPNRTYRHHLIHFFSHLHQSKLIWVRVHLKYTEDIVLGCFYYPLRAHISVLEDLQKSLHAVNSAYPTAKILVRGDFNSSSINLSNGSTVQLNFNLTLVCTIPARE